MPPIGNAISLTGVTKTFGSTVAVDSLDLVVPTGALYGFIGPNGAGKTTTLHESCRSCSGSAESCRCWGGRQRSKPRIAWLSAGRARRISEEKAGVPTHGAAERLRDSRAEPRGCVARTLTSTACRTRNARSCSKGMLQKVQLISAVHTSRNLCYPRQKQFRRLDPVNMRLLRDLILAEHRRGERPSSFQPT